MLLLDLLTQAYKSQQVLNLTKEEIKSVQRKKFIKLVDYIEQKSPYYKKIIKENNINILTCVPKDFPVLTKEILLRNFNEIVTDNAISLERVKTFLEKDKNPEHLFLGKYYVIHTSGSSGSIGYYVYSQKEMIEGISPVVRNNGIQFFQKLAFVAATNGHFAGATLASIAKKLPFVYSQVKMYNIDTPFQTLLDEINDLKPTIISGYVFGLKELAKAQRSGKLSIFPKILQSGGEPLLEKDKEYIQNTFNAPIIDVYAASEHMIMGIGCDKFKGMYLMEDNLQFEFHRDYSCVTNLYNYTLPLIRYKMTDSFHPVADDVGLMPFTKIHSISGRSEHYLWFVNDLGEKDFIRPNAFDEIAVDQVERFQIHLKGSASFVVKICLSKNIPKEVKRKTLEKVKKKVTEILQQKKMTKIRYHIETVDQLWADSKTGKYKIVVV